MNTDTNSSPKATGCLLLFRNSEWDQHIESPEQARAAMDRVVAWFEDLSRRGKVAGGQPLLSASRMVTGTGGKSVTDGPFVEAKEVIGGYLLLTTTSLDEAVAIARTNPMLEYGLSIEVRQTAEECPTFHRILQGAVGV